MIKFITYQDVNKQYRWRIMAANGRIIGESGEGYNNRSDRDEIMWKIIQSVNSNEFMVTEAV